MSAHPTNQYSRKDITATMDAHTIQTRAISGAIPPPGVAPVARPPRVTRRKRRGKEAQERRRWFRLVAAALGNHEPPYCTGIDVPRRFVASIARQLGPKDIIVQVRDTHVEEYRTLTAWHRSRFDPLALADAFDAEELAEARAERSIGRPRGARAIPRPWSVSA